VAVRSGKRRRLIIESRGACGCVFWLVRMSLVDDVMQLRG